jgi:uncharacterized membrane protein YphA (DoxX/SURF4 family)
MPYALWIVQGLLALTFLTAGAGKLLASAAELNENFPMPDEFMRFIGVCELLGAIGLIVPGVLRIRRGLTSLAAAGLAIIMTGATVLTLADGNIGALVPLVLGLLAVFVAYGRRSWLAMGLRGPGRSATPGNTDTLRVPSSIAH